MATNEANRRTAIGDAVIGDPADPAWFNSAFCKASQLLNSDALIPKSILEELQLAAASIVQTDKVTIHAQ